jgi:hypothetical protein
VDRFFCFLRHHCSCRPPAFDSSPSSPIGTAPSSSSSNRTAPPSSSSNRTAPPPSIDWSQPRSALRLRRSTGLSFAQPAVYVTRPAICVTRTSHLDRPPDPCPSARRRSRPDPPLLCPGSTRLVPPLFSIDGVECRFCQLDLF